MIRHYEMSPARDFETLRRDGNSLFSDLIDLFEKSFRVYDHAVAENARFVLVDDTRRQKQGYGGTVWKARASLDCTVEEFLVICLPGLKKEVGRQMKEEFNVA